MRCGIVYSRIANSESDIEVIAKTGPKPVWFASVQAPRRLVS
jgi:hypothetical protein